MITILISVMVGALIGVGVMCLVVAGRSEDPAPQLDRLYQGGALTEPSRPRSRCGAVLGVVAMLYLAVR